MESHLDMSASIRSRVKSLRTERGWTQQRLAVAVGVSRQSINSIERDRYVPSLMLALNLARVFECPVDQIFTLEGFFGGPDYLRAQWQARGEVPCRAPTPGRLRRSVLVTPRANSR